VSRWVRRLGKLVRVRSVESVSSGPMPVRREYSSRSRRRRSVALQTLSRRLLLLLLKRSIVPIETKRSIDQLSIAQFFPDGFQLTLRMR